MDKELIQAIIALLRADTDPTDGINTKVGGRFYLSSQVPANAAFPRCYIEPRRPLPSTIWNKRDGAVDRVQPIAILFASTTAVSSKAAFDIMDWDARARTLVEYQKLIPTLVSFIRMESIENLPQADDLTTYIMGGSLYHASIQEG